LDVSTTIYSSVRAAAVGSLDHKNQTRRRSALQC
jgi:hypothetical protein